MKEKQKRENGIQISVRFKPEVLEIIQDDAKKLGVSVAAYLSMLASQKRIESQAMQFMAKLPPERIKQFLETQENETKID